MPLFAVRDELMEVAYQVAGDRIEAAIYTQGKTARTKAVGALKTEVKAAILDKFPTRPASRFPRRSITSRRRRSASASSTRGKRCDGRGFLDIRALTCGGRPSPALARFSALFQRGETQALCLATLASSSEAQNLDAYTGGEQSKRFILHYNFPPFSVGETGRTGSPGRREIGHGALAERSIAAVIPAEKDFPYAIRVVSEIMESNGST